MKFKIIGAGAGGNKAAICLINRGVVESDDVILVNSTKKDIPVDFKGRVIILNPNDTGCGKEREIAHEYAVNSIKAGAFDDIFDKDDDSVLIITSIEGGTGSGSTPIIGKYISEVLGKNVHICAFAGFNADVRGLQNSVEFFQEIDFDADIQCIDLKSFNSISGGNHFKAEELADIELAERTRILFGQNLQASSQIIDDTDIYKVVSTTGYKTIEHLEFKEDLMDVNQFNALCKKMIYSSKSLKCENPAQLRLGVILNIREASEDAVDYDFTTIKDAYGMPYETFFHKQYDGGVQYIQFIASGMKLPIEEVKQMHERYKESSAKVNKSADEFFNEVKSLEKDAADNQFDMVRNQKKASTTKANFFKEL